MASPSVTEIYADARGRFVNLVASLSDEQLETWVPACPQWSVRNVLAHLVGATEDFLTSNFPSQRTPAECWTAMQVARGEGKSAEQLLAEYDQLAPRLEQMLAAGSVPEGPLINDLATHEQDVRCALGLPGGRDSRGYAFALNRWVTRLGERLNEAQLAALRLQSEEWIRVAGTGEAGACIRGSAFELVRALAGRRSYRQLAAFHWSGESAPYVRLIPIMGPSKFDLIESA